MDPGRIQADERREASSRFIRSNSFGRAVDWDTSLPIAEECRLVVSTGWDELDRNLRALENLDRELRRLAKAFDVSMLGRSESGSATWSTLISELKEFPTPLNSATGALQTLDSCISPLRFLLQPTGVLGEAVSFAPMSSLVYAMSFFASDFHVAAHRGAALEAVRYSDRPLLALDGVLDGEWPGSSRGSELAWKVEDVPRARYKPVAHRSSAPPVKVALWRRARSGHEDVVTVMMS